MSTERTAPDVDVAGRGVRRTSSEMGTDDVWAEAAVDAP